jgi:hypothetical protein
MLARVLDLIPTSLRQFIPLNGIFAEAWKPSTAIALYWFESLLLAVVAVALCWRLQRRTPEEQLLVKKASIEPGPVAVFHVGSLAVFGAFLGGILFILTAKGHLPPFDFQEFRGAATSMMLVIGVGFVLDMIVFQSIGVAAVESRVNACLGRWALLWLLGFAGTAMLVFTGRPGTFIGFFAILKTVWEVWGMLARLFGWKSLKERNAQPQID